MSGMVVIDPDDREAVERLARAYCYEANPRSGVADKLQAALRSFAAPKPVVFEHLAVSDRQGVVRSLCGKVWRSHVRTEVTIEGRCPSCEAEANAGWVV